MFTKIFLSFYLFYIFRHFKTTYSFNHPFQLNLTGWFKHPIRSSLYENKICDFGKLSILFLIGTIIFDNCISKNIVFIITLLLSLLNMNAFVYLIPYFIYYFCKN